MHQQELALNSSALAVHGQAEPSPRRWMSAVPAEWFLKTAAATGSRPAVFDEYIRCFTRDDIGSCRDYRQVR